MKGMLIAAALVLLALLLSGCAPAVRAPAPSPVSGVRYQSISAKEAKERMDGEQPVLVVDVRTKAEYEAGHIPGAILLPNESIGADRPDVLPNLDAEILVYCRSGNRSAQAARKLIALGYTRVFDFGGILSWPYETVTGPEP